ncbi:MAG: queuosine precursor transporter [Firmicutes bacterium]|nr:queuosine precursor transporter [Bacillota bacterium]
MRQYRYFHLIMAFFVAILLTSEVAAAKIIRLGALSMTGGVIIFPLSYIFGDILTEVYGYARSRVVIWTGFAAAVLMSLAFLAVGALPSDPFWAEQGGQGAWDLILGITPRIVAGSLLAYFVGEFMNSYVLAKMKLWTTGRWLWTRTIGSTVVGEGLDTVIFVLAAFAGSLPPPLLGRVILSNYAAKVALEVLLTPVTYTVVGFLKRAENEDYYDRHTNFNPFVIGTASEPADAGAESRSEED